MSNLRRFTRRRHFLRSRGKRRDAAVSGYDWQGHPVYEIIEYSASKSTVGQKQFKYVSSISVRAP